MGIVRFIGSTEFAEGVWLGVELRKPSKLWGGIYCMHNNSIHHTSTLVCRLVPCFEWRGLYIV